MQGSPAVVAGLNAVYRCLLALEQQAHMQEHLFENRRWSFSKWWDDIETNGHEKLIHPLMNRVLTLGGALDWRYGFDPSISEDVGEALRTTLESLSDLRLLYGAACEAAEADDDYGTEKMIWKHITWVEKRINKFEARLAKLTKVGTQAFLAEYL